MKAAHPEHVHIVRYEDLLLDSARSLQEICDFLGIEYQKGVLNAKRAEGVVPTWETEWKGNSMAKIDPAHAHQWKKNGDPALIALVEQLAHTEMVSLGYALSAPDRRYTWRDQFYKGMHGLVAEASVLYREYLSGKKNRFRERGLKQVGRS